jgi:hypothetical protein
MKTHRPLSSRSALALLLTATAGSSAVSQAQMVTPSAPVTFKPHADPWAPGRERFWDIRNNSFNGFLSGSQEFRYDNAYKLKADGTPSWNTQVSLTYDKTPATSYFMGRIEARGLKPNFAYQIKLLGKPQKGPGSWGAVGDGVGNERIGYAGRWWCGSNHATATNFDDSHFVNYFKNAAAGTEHDIYGYLFSGIFVTDSRGNASVDITGRNSYHITWQSWQSGRKDVLAGTWSVGSWLRDSNSSSPYYGYGSKSLRATNTTLYYEYETGRPQPVVLAPGTYNCRMVLTEESFHNTTTDGGYWKGVLSTEEVGDDLLENDIVFTVSAPVIPVIPAAPTGLAAQTASRTSINLSWADASNNETGFKIERSVNGGSWSQIATKSANTTSMSDSSLSRNTAYAYRVRAYNAAGNSSYSATASARTLK